MNRSSTFESAVVRPQAIEIVLAEDEGRGSGNGRALDRPFGRHDAGEIPEDRRAEIEMRIIGEDRLPGLCPRAGDHPFVRRPMANSGQRAHLVVDVIAARMPVPERWQRGDRLAGLCGRKQPVRLIRSEFLQETGAQELEPEALRQLIGFELGDDERIGRLPGFGMIAGKEEFGRQRVAVDEGVDAVGIGGEAFLRPGREGREARLGLAVEADGANEFVDAEKLGALDLRHPSLTDPAQDLHLEHPFARMEVAERPRRVVRRGGEDVRNAEVVTPDANIRCEARQFLGAGIGGHGAIEEIAAAQCRQDDQREDEARRPVDPWPHHSSSRVGHGDPIGGSAAMSKARSVPTRARFLPLPEDRGEGHGDWPIRESASP